MPTYKVTDPGTGKTLRLTGDSPPTEAELVDIFSQYGSQQDEPDATLNFEKQAPRLADIDESQFSQATLQGDAFIMGLEEGIKRAGQGLTQLFVPGGGLVPLSGEPEKAKVQKQELDDFQRGVKLSREEFDISQVGQRGGGKAGTFVGETAPYIAMPGGVAGGLAKKTLTSGIAGGAAGAAQFRENPDDIVEDTLLGATFGSGFNLLGSGVKNTFDFLARALGGKTAREIKNLGGNELSASTANRVADADRLGIQITPAEASGSSSVAAKQGRLGISERGGQKLERFANKRIEQERIAISDFLSDVSPSGSSANQKVKSKAKKIINDADFARAQAAKPFYEKSFKDKIPPAQLKELLDNDPVIKNAYKKILSNPAFQRELKDADLNDIKTIDAAKQFLDDQIEASLDKFGKITNEGRILTEAKNNLLEFADAASPDYKKAREIFQQRSGRVERLKGSPIGQIARLTDANTKTVSKKLFDPAETDINVIKKLNREFRAEDPQAWRKLIRNEFERRLDESPKGRSASVFYDKILRKERDFKMFMAAADGFPGMQKALISMRNVFKNIIDPETVKGAAGKAKSSLNVPRSSAQFVLDKVNEIGGAGFDRASIDIITNPVWHEDLTRALRGKSLSERMEELSGLIGRVAAVQQDELP